MIPLLSGNFLQSRKIPLLRLKKFQGVIFSIQGINFSPSLQFKIEKLVPFAFTGLIWSPFDNILAIETYPPILKGF